MTNHRPTTTGEHGRWRDAFVGEPLISNSAAAFRLAGLAMIASLIVPVALGTVVDWAWAPAIALAGTALLAATVGLLSLYPRVNDRYPALATTGVVGAFVAGLGSLGLLAIVGVAAAMAIDGNLARSAPVELFKLLALTVMAGLSLGLLSFGLSVKWAADDRGTAGTLMIGGGGVLLAAITGELLRWLGGVGAPPWLLFPVLVLITADMVAIARTLSGVQ